MAREGTDIAISKGTTERMTPARRFGDITRAMDEFMGRRWMRPFDWDRWTRPVAELSFAPSVDVIDRDDEVVVRAEIPGYRKEDIEVSVSDGSLIIKGETHTSESEEKGDFYRCEISHGAFTRTVGLPAAVDDSKASASMKDGMLELTLPKLEKSKRKAISIS